MSKVEKFVFALLMLVIIPCLGRAESRQRLTVMVYMCGSSLESAYGAGTRDMDEMTAALRSEDITLLVMTGGSLKWQNHEIDPEALTITRIGMKNGRTGSAVVDRQPSASMGDPDTLTYFLNFAADNYPADNYGLIMWDHGNGPMEGLCLDERFKPDRMDVEELAEALHKSPFSKEKLEWIGFDACLMESVEIALQVAPYVRYMIGSEETEPEDGWDYSFLADIDADTDGAETGRLIVDYYIRDAKPGEFKTLSCIDLSRIEALRTRLDELFSLWQNDVDPQTYSAIAKQRKAIMGYGLDVARNMRDHDLVDLGDLISTLSRENQSVGSLVSEAIDEVVLHKASTLDDSSGLSVYFPYYNKERYFSDWKAKYESFGIGEAYTHFIRSFGDILIGKPLAEWDNLPLGLYFGAREERVASRLMNLESAADISAKSEVDDGIITAEDIRSVQEGLLAKVPLTTQQQAAFASARLMVMERTRTFLTDQYHYRLVYTSPALDMDADGAIRSTYQEQTLHVVDQSGKSQISEISYRTLDNGEIAVDVAARSGYGDDADEVRMVMTFRLDDGGALTRSGIYVYDPLTDVYEHRYAYDAERYPYIAFPDRYIVPQSGESGDSVIWTEEDDFTRESIIRYLDDWHLEFRTTSDTRALGVLVEITDTQNNRHYTDMRTINTGSESPDLIKGGLYVRALAEGMEVNGDGITINLTLIGNDAFTQNIWIYAPTVNGRESAFVTENGNAAYQTAVLEHGKSISRYLTISAEGVDEVDELGMRFSYIYPMDTNQSDTGASEGIPLEMCSRVFSGPAKIIPNAPVPVTENSILLTAFDFSTVWGTGYREALNRPSLKGAAPIASEMMGEQTLLMGFARIPENVGNYDRAYIYAGRLEDDLLRVSRIGECVELDSETLGFMIPGRRVSLLAGETTLPLCIGKDFNAGLPYSLFPIDFYVDDILTNYIDSLMTLGTDTVREMSWMEGLYGVEFSQIVTTDSPVLPITAGSALDGVNSIENRADVGKLPLRLRCEDPSDESMYVVFLDQYDNVMYAMPVFSNQLMEAELDGSLEALKAELAGRESRVTRTLPTGDKVTLRQLGDWIFRNTYGGIRIVGYVGNQSRVEVPESLDGKNVLEVLPGAFDGKHIESITFPSTVSRLDCDAFGSSASQSALVLRSVSNAVFIDLDTSLSPKDNLALYSDGTLTVKASRDAVKCEESGSLTGVISVTTGATTDADDTDSLEHYPYSATIRAIEKWGFRHVMFDDAEFLWLPPVMYRRTEGGSWVILSYGGSDSTVFIPAGVEGERVTGIDDHAFQRNMYHYVRTVEIEEGIETIGERAFAGSSVEEITLPESLKRIAPDAFDGCGMLRRVTVKCDPANLPDGLFASCTLLGDGALALNDGADATEAGRLLGNGRARKAYADTLPGDLLGYWESSAIYDGNGMRWPGGPILFSITLHENGTYSGYFMGSIQGRWTAQDGVIRAGDMLLIPDGSGGLTVYRNYWRITSERK